MKKIILIFFLFIVSLNNVHAQIDTCFWFGAPWISPDHWLRDDIANGIYYFKMRNENSEKIVKVIKE